MEYEKNITIRTPATLHRRLEALAKTRGQSIHRLCLDLLQEAAFRHPEPDDTEARRLAQLDAQVASVVEGW